MSTASRSTGRKRADDNVKWALNASAMTLACVLVGVGIGVIHWILAESAKEAALNGASGSEARASATYDDRQRPARKAVKTW